MTEYKIYYVIEKGKRRTFDGKSYATEGNNITGSNFELSKAYEPTDENLKIYHEEIKKWASQISNTFTQLKIKPSYLDAYTDIMAAVRFFNFMCKSKYDSHDKIDALESKYIDLPYNGGLMYLKPQDKARNIYTNDKNMYYTEVMGNEEHNFYIPNKEGYETTIKKLKLDKLKYGFYHIKITAKNEDSYKIFSFSDKNWYNYYCVKFMLENPEYFEYEIINDDEPNAYLYDSVVKCSDICSNWFKKLQYLKKQFPKNSLVKNLTRAWGGLSVKNVIKIDENEFDNNPEKYKKCFITGTDIYGEYDTPDYKVILKLQNIDDDIYKYNIRLKSWLNSYCRTHLAKTILKNIKYVTRIQTDSISYTKDIKPNETEKRELKSSGYIYFKTVNTYYHECLDCNEQFKYKDYIKHTH